MKRTCKQCGKDFFLTKSEIDFYNSKNLTLPKRCKECRELNKGKTTLDSATNVGKKTNGDYGNTHYITTGESPYRPAIPKWLAITAIVILILVLGIIAILSRNDDSVDASYEYYQNEISSDDSIDYDDDYDYLFDDSDITGDELVEDLESDEFDEIDELIDKADENGLPAESDEASKEAEKNVDIAVEIEKTEVTAVEAEQEETVIAEAEQSDEAGAVVAETDKENAIAVENDGKAETVNLRFRNKKLLQDHYVKHGIDMGFASAEEYQSAAVAVVNNPNALSKAEKADGDMAYYVEATNEYVVVSTDGYIRTYFKPDRGKKYFDSK